MECLWSVLKSASSLPSFHMSSRREISAVETCRARSISASVGILTSHDRNDLSEIRGFHCSGSQFIFISEFCVQKGALSTTILILSYVIFIRKKQTN